MLTVQSDEHFMRMALVEAQKAYDLQEVPVGAVIVSGGRIIARAHNLTEHLNDVTAHAEMLAFTSASEYLGSKYLWDCTLFVTLEPCVMCAGAAFWTQIDRIVYGASDEKRGFRRADSHLLHPKTIVEGGLLAEESTVMLQDFFRKLRS